MLKKVFKYDFLAIARVAVPLLSVVLGLGVLNCGLDAILCAKPDIPDRFLWVTWIATSLFVTSYIAIAVLDVIVAIQIYSRYYKSVFTDEGYLTLVLPVSTHRLLLGKFLASSLWIVISAAATVLSIVVSLIPIMVSMGPENTATIVASILRMFTESIEELGVLNFVIQIILSVTVLIENILIVFAGITAGATVMRNHRVIGAVVFVYIANTVQSVMHSIIQGVLTPLILNGDVMIYYTVSNIVQFVIAAVIAVVSYFVTYKIVHRGVNLE